MAYRESTALKNSKLAKFVADFPAGSKLEIRTGARPAAASDAAAGVLLATIVTPADPWGAIANGSVAKQNQWQVAAVADGVAGHFRLLQGADAGGADAAAVRLDGTVSMDGTGDLDLDNTNIATEQVVTITAFTVNG